MRVFPFRPTGGLDFELNESARNLVLTVLASLFAAMLFFGLREPMTGSGFHRFGDFYALWTSGFICHEGQPALNYDSDALHLRQAMLGMNPLEFNPFPYPPTFLLMLAPFGGLGLGVAFALFMSLTFAFYLWAMTGGNFRSMPRLCGALLAPATTITLVSGQSGYLSGALMLGGLRLAGSRPIVAGVLFGLLAYKPQLGLLLPVALISAGLWRSIASAAATVVVCAVASSWAFGADIWPLWVHQMVYYSGELPHADDRSQCAHGWAAREDRPGSSGRRDDPGHDRRLARVSRRGDGAGGRASRRRHIPRDSARLQLRHADDDGGDRVVFRGKLAGAARPDPRRRDDADARADPAIRDVGAGGQGTANLLGPAAAAVRNDREAARSFGGAAGT
jgi:hypothetical protein